MAGPKTPEGREVALANLAMDGSARIQSGAFMRHGVLMPCAKCMLRDCPERREGEVCRAEEVWAVERRAQVRALEHVEPVDWPTVELLVWAELRLQRLARYMAASGEYLPGGPQYVELQPAAEHAPKLINVWRSLAVALGIGPLERKRLSATGEGGPGAVLARVFAEVAEARAEQAAATVEGDFEADGVEGADDGNPLAGDV